MYTKKPRPKAAWHKKTHGFACVYPAEIGCKNARMRQHAGVFAANFSSNLLWQNCFAPFAAYVFLCQAA